MIEHHNINKLLISDS